MTCETEQNYQLPKLTNDYSTGPYEILFFAGNASSFATFLPQSKVVILKPKSGQDGNYELKIMICLKEDLENCNDFILRYQVLKNFEYDFLRENPNKIIDNNLKAKIHKFSNDGTIIIQFSSSIMIPTNIKDTEISEYLKVY